ncbi:heme b synthase [Desulfonatronovibrio hydrogenovorans]|uniref:heme b synthase n=1 Tax=Desulfonatronovibrio hydrogenovorans TaxID=53245 RepID=UPI0005505D00|nr:heme b synthase [Desulfonatronovibrio hydrogenovorans]
MHPNHNHSTKTLPLRLVAWEITRSCNLACKHCRAEAHPEPFAGELTTKEAMDLIDTFPATGDPVVIFTGGEPLLRPDVFDLVAYASSLGLRCVMAPNGTLITRENAGLMKQSGIQRCSISIDGPTAPEHDLFRGVPGAFDQAMTGIEHLKRAGIPFQINTTVTRDNLDKFKDIFQLAHNLGAVAWHIFMLVPTGRGSEISDQAISAREYEEVLNWFYDFRKTTDMHLKATCAPHYYRIMRQRARQDNIAVTKENFGLDAMSRGCLGGIGFCFISHTGQVQPCGYLELDCGNIRKQPFPEIWKGSSRFLELRDINQYKGKCGICEYHRVCGGCRARAFTMEKDHLAPEPLCTYEPARTKKD